MKSDIQDTSLEAYKLIKPKLGEKQSAVFEIIEKHPNLCNYEIAEKLGWDINTVTPRCKELRAYGLVYKNGKKICNATNREVYKMVSLKKMLKIYEVDYKRFITCLENDIKRGYTTPINKINKILHLKIKSDEEYLDIINKYQINKFTIDDFKKLKKT